MNKINANTIKEYTSRQTGRLRDEMRRNWQEMAAADAPAGKMATAFTVGTVISTIPVPLVDMALAAYVTRRYDEMPRAPFLTGMAVANNLVMAPLYAATPKVGGLALYWLASHLAVAAPEALLLRIIVGYLLIALGLGLAAFVLSSTGFRGYQAVRRPQPADASPVLGDDMLFGRGAI
ncbi:MAG: DUF2062 domain-containing protein [Candidatus Promineofilum sp.]|nr:DUF2062 domain-containing protein [Promineifilum sp.]